LIREAKKGLAARILELGLAGIQHTSRVRDASAWMLAKCFSRADISGSGSIQSFLRWTVDKWSPGETSTFAGLAFTRCGALQAWNQTLKAAPRKLLQPVWLQVLEIMLQGPTGQGDTDFRLSTALRKLRCAVICRATLVALPPRLAAWRYERGARSLLLNFGCSAGTGPAQTCTGKTGDMEGSAQDTIDDVNEDVDVPPQVEEAIEMLLTSLADADTVVRWAAAKGIGRVTSRLSQDFS